MITYDYYFIVLEISHILEYNVYIICLGGRV
jgi:hypothetical protein